ncbi:redox-regulated ATPase YchF [Ichthyobacterium seriolicida]|uniref:Ribosome-binding ATPase YchF n=1 Tax=Ichthyobacterium seriolicida TaxID=242600 RepID=A0A1J1E8X3_9FLAO|nr:redox-regulated ATPase YchF [Ichthyobacterium seriolicida]BAV94371.1 GTP-binding and nucleic acid-binding protein YchF [Ichthyobacterium seriolicida]
MKCGIVGLPNVGKSTLFNCISKVKVKSDNFPFCTIDPNVGIINVPDARIYELEKIVKPEKIQPATVEIVDIAGLVKGASKGEGLGNKFLSNIRETNAIIHVLRCFDDNNIIHVDGSVDPIRDREIIDTELQIKDLETLEKALVKTQKNARTGNKEANRELAILNKYKEALESGLSAISVEALQDEIDFINNMMLLTSKPVIYVCNVDESSAKSGNKYVDKVRESVKDENAQILVVAVGTEAEISELEDTEERDIFLSDLGLEEPGINKLIRSAYSLLNLQTYFTAGKKEVRAWTIKKGYTAPQAAGVIHTDFERGFIKAEVLKYEDFISLGSELACKEAGKLHIEGKEYVVCDGDIMNFRFNV